MQGVGTIRSAEAASSHAAWLAVMGAPAPEAPAAICDTHSWREGIGATEGSKQGNDVRVTTLDFVRRIHRGKNLVKKSHRKKELRNNTE